jgi:cytidylate kinase
MRGFQIAIDGPVAAGKGTISKLLAERLNFLYVDTGATYRVATLLATRENFNFELIDKEDGETVQRLIDIIRACKIEMNRPNQNEQDGRLITVKINGEDVSWAIRAPEVSNRVALVAKLPQVREVMVEKQREIANNNDVVMEGRDITYRVLPEANLKIYMDAATDVRVDRRCEQLVGQGLGVDKDEVKKQLIIRDELDQNRTTDPLRRVADAWYVDTSNLTIEQVVETILEKVKQLRNQ